MTEPDVGLAALVFAAAVVFGLGLIVGCVAGAWLF